MKTLAISVAAFLSFTAACFGESRIAAAKDKKVYHGAWFAISYPCQFTVRPGIPGRTTGGPDRRHDSAFFVSPDRTVEFYVYAPQWNGDPTDYALNPRLEAVVGRKQERINRKKTGGLEDTFRVLWTTVRAKNGAYIRSWVDTENVTLDTRVVFGIKYVKSRSYAKYRRDYEAFKKSLEQYAD